MIGAQAVFEMTKHRDDLPFTLTKDADTSLAPGLVDPAFEIGAAMEAAGFHLKRQGRPGIWCIPAPGMGSDPDDTGFDILVPEAVAGPGRRGARLEGQDKMAVGRAEGIELSLIDRHERRIEALDGSSRFVDAFVAGPAAILCAKSFKLMERIQNRNAGRRDRLRPKDASDAWLIMNTSDPGEVRRIFDTAEADPVMGASVRRGRDYLVTLFTDGGDGVDLAVNDYRSRLDEGLVRRLMSAWMTDFGQ